MNRLHEKVYSAFTNNGIVGEKANELYDCMNTQYNVLKDMTVIRMGEFYVSREDFMLFFANTAKSVYEVENKLRPIKMEYSPMKANKMLRDIMKEV